VIGLVAPETIGTGKICLNNHNRCGISQTKRPIALIDESARSNDQNRLSVFFKMQEVGQTIRRIEENKSVIGIWFLTVIIE
jgi:hypothetical protein